MDFRTPWPTIRPTIRKTASRLRSTWSWAPPPDSTRTGQSDARGFTDVRASGGDPKKRQKFSLYPAFVPADRLPPGGTFRRVYGYARRTVGNDGYFIDPTACGRPSARYSRASRVARRPGPG